MALDPCLQLWRRYLSFLLLDTYLWTAPVRDGGCPLMKQKELHHLQKKKKKQKGNPGVTKRETLCYLRNFVQKSHEQSGWQMLHYIFFETIRQNLVSRKTRNLIKCDKRLELWLCKPCHVVLLHIPKRSVKIIQRKIK